MDGRFHRVQLAYLQSRQVEYLFATAEQRKEIPLSATDHLVGLAEKAGRSVSDTKRTGMRKVSHKQAFTYYVTHTFSLVECLGVVYTEMLEKERPP